MVVILTYFSSCCKNAFMAKISKTAPERNQWKLPEMVRHSLRSALCAFTRRICGGMPSAHCSLSPAHCSLLTAYFPLLSAHCSLHALRGLLSALFSLLYALCSLLSALCSMLSALCSLPSVFFHPSIHTNHPGSE